MTRPDHALIAHESATASAQAGSRSLAFTRAAAVLITVGIGAASFVLSFAALRDLAARAGISERLAWLWPLIVDGTILQATMAVVALAGRRDQDRSRRYFWIVLASSAAVSVGANALHAVIPGSAPLSPWLAAGIAVVAPVSLLASTHGLSLLIRVSGPVDSVERQSEVATGEAPQQDQPTAPPAVIEVNEQSEQRNAPVAVDALQPWESMAEVIASREGAQEFEVTDVASVLHLSYERELSHQAIGRQLGIDHRVVYEIVSASSELLRSGDVSVERVAV
ncbi:MULTISPECIES: DUF2637 domain-containing protein [unclassified Mycobacterium]|uniref:DUF2637 domain-containing protein n=1 Tax=unclassified Mycobacterium TaxID=2642494 RepID=UPI0029C6AD8B|nr:MULTISPECIES: DUF2637 domain-containing protein [unclassified Mycobacterium]